jgi:molybdopterin-guanine dinucleotide biosynthesis protein A
MPDLTVEDLARLHQAWVADSKLCCAVVQESDRPEPLVAVYPGHLLASLQELADSKDRSLMRWIGKRDHVQVILSNPSCRNVNTNEDLPLAGL